MRATNCSPGKARLFAGVFFFLSTLTLWRPGIDDATKNVAGGIPGAENGNVNGLSAGRST